MGWCSATEIMDTAVTAVLTTVSHTVRAVLENGSEWQANSAALDKAVQEIVDSGELAAVLSPFVSTIAAQLRASDWDCIEESEYFDRFAQEMLGKDDQQYVAYLHDKLRDIEPGEHDFADLVRELADATERMENAG